MPIRLAAHPAPAELDACLYDLREIGWPGELDFYLHEAREAAPDGRVIEVACGTGRVAHALARAGFRVTGVDRSAEMLAVARARAPDSANPTFVRADMRSFALPERFDLAIIPGHSFQFMTTPADQLAALQRIRAHLVAGGRLVVHVDHNSLDALAAMDGRERTGPVITDPDSGRCFRAGFAWTYDHAWQQARLRMSWCELDGDGDILARFELAPAVAHVPTATELEHALLRAGFADPAVIGAFDGSALRADSEEMIWTARVP